jgi:hypothetical protein
MAQASLVSLNPQSSMHETLPEPFEAVATFEPEPDLSASLTLAGRKHGIGYHSEQQQLKRGGVLLQSTITPE